MAVAAFVLSCVAFVFSCLAVVVAFIYPSSPAMQRAVHSAADWTQTDEEPEDSVDSFLDAAKEAMIADHPEDARRRGLIDG